MYFLVFLYSRGFIFHIPWRTVTNACLSFILLCAAPVQPSTDSCKNYCKVPAVIFHRGHPDCIPDKSNKKESRHWKNISQEMLLTKIILLLLSKGRAHYTTGKFHCCFFSSPPSTMESMYTTLLSFKSWKSYPCVIRK